jgi:ribosomal-protein-alanine N-acetyltransferase
MVPKPLRRWGDYFIRQCTTEDIPQVISINLSNLPEHYSDSFFEQLLKDNPESFLVAEVDGKVIGYVMCRIEYGFSAIKKFGFARKGHLVSIAISEPHRNKGLGIVLMTEVMNALKIKNCSEMYLEVRISNVVGIKLYEKLKFNNISRLRWYYRDGEDAYLMGTSF